MSKNTNQKFNLIDFFLIIFIFCKVGVISTNNIVVFLLSKLSSTGYVPQDILEYLSLAAFIILVFFRVIKKGRLLMTKQTFFYFLFTVFSSLSYFWSLNKSFAISSLVSVVALWITLFALTNYIDSKEKLIKVMKYVVIANLLVALKIIVLYWFQSGSAATRIKSITGIYFNTVGQILGFSVLFSIYLYRYTNKRKYLYLIIPQFMAIILTESRKSLLIPVLGIFLFLILQRNMTKLLKYTFIAMVLGGLLVFSVSKISPSIYHNIVGEMGELVKYSRGEITNDWSINLRSFFIETGKNIFIENPIKGIGLNNFSYYVGHYTTYGTERYSHNNYIEMLSCLGIIGFLLYYSSYFYCFIKLLKNILKNKKDSFSILSLSFLIVLMIMEWGVVSYSGCVYHIYILFVYYTIIFQKELWMKIGDRSD